MTVKTRENGGLLELTVKLPAAEAQLPEPDCVQWEASEAVSGKGMWGEVPEAGTYEVKLYRDGGPVFGKDHIEQNLYFFYIYMKEAGTYTFQVRSLPKEGEEAWSKPSEWVWSDSFDVPEDEANERNGGRWLQEGNRWKYQKENGVLAVQGWKSIGGQWYLFDSDGYMLTGWQKTGGKWYYMDDESGMMKAGCWIGNYQLSASGAWIE